MVVEDLPLDRLTIRWTVGSVRERGFEMLRLSVASAVNLFGSLPRYVICVNNVSVAEAAKRTGALPECVEWMKVEWSSLPPLLLPYLDKDVIEGMGWKLIPLRLDADRYELAIDNDVILWDIPMAMRQWLSSENSALFAEDVDRCLGSFDELTIPGNLNAGIRGLSPGFTLEPEMRYVLRTAAEKSNLPFRLKEEIEEQGLQAAAISQISPLHIVSKAEVSICSPFWPRDPELGTCGAHFVGMNAHHIPWDYFDKPADVWLAEHWARHREALYRRAAIAWSPDERNASLVGVEAS